MDYCKGDKDWDLVKFLKDAGDSSEYPFPIGEEKHRDITVCGKKFTAQSECGYEFHVISNGTKMRGFPVKPYKLQRRGKMDDDIEEGCDDQYAYLVDSVGRVWIYDSSNYIFESPCLKLCDYYVFYHDPANYDHFKEVQRANVLKE